MLGLALIAGTLLVLGAIGASAALMRTPSYNAETLCLKEAPPPAHTLILVDATDRLDVRHQRRLKTIAQQEAGKLPRWGRLTLLTLRPDTENAPRDLFDGCTPGDRTNANPLWENVRKLETLKRTRFDDPIDAALTGARGGRGAEGSPIVEGLYAAAADPDFVATPAGRKLVLVSDLLQFSPGRFSLYAPDQSWTLYQASPGALRTPPDLISVDIRVVVLERRDKGEQQTAAQSNFWVPYFDEAGAKSVAWER